MEQSITFRSAPIRRCPLYRIRFTPRVPPGPLLFTRYLGAQKGRPRLAPPLLIAAVALCAAGSAYLEGHRPKRPVTTIAAPPAPPRACRDEATAGGRERAAAVEASLMEEARLGGVLPSLPDTVRARLARGPIEASYEVCVGRDGTVTAVAPRAGLAEADDAIVDALCTWRHKALPGPVCFVQDLRFVLGT